MISATTHFTEREMRIARRSHQRRRKVWLWLFPPLGLLYSGWGMWRFMQGGSQEGLYILAIVVGIYLVFRTPILNYRAIRILRKNPQLNQTIRWTFTEEGLRGESDGSTLSTRWDQLFESASTLDGHLLYPQKDIYYWIPKTGFARSEDHEAFRELLRAKTKHREVV